MAEDFFGSPILNSPYAPPAKHWELEGGQPTNRVFELLRHSGPIARGHKPRVCDDG